jgi:hypothetical protein
MTGFDFGTGFRSTFTRLIRSVAMAVASSSESAILNFSKYNFFKRICFKTKRKRRFISFHL